jgi:hypothetical protein
MVAPAGASLQAVLSTAALVDPERKLPLINSSRQPAPHDAP